MWLYDTMRIGPSPVPSSALAVESHDDERKERLYEENVAVMILTRSQAVARIADRTAKNCKGHMT